MDYNTIFIKLFTVVFLTRYNTKVMSSQKRTLIAIAKKVISHKPLTPSEVTYLLEFEKVNKDTPVTKRLKQIALPAALAFGFLFSALPDQFNDIVKHIPAWTNFSPPILAGVDFLWDILGDPVKKANSR